MLLLMLLQLILSKLIFVMNNLPIYFSFYNLILKMLVQAITIFLILLMLFLYATSKLVANLGNSPYVNVFYVLMFITFLTLLQVVFCFYMYLKFRTKDGEEGPRGYQGFPGDKGDPGVCDQMLCRADSIRVMIEKIFQKKLNRELTPKEKKTIYASSNLFDKSVLAAALLKTGNGSNIKVINLNQENIVELHQYLTEIIELDYLRIDNFSTEIGKYFPL
jgi:hypothetical protein